MSEEKNPTTTRKRRTKAELRAWLEGELRRLAEEEKAEVVKLVSDAHDTLSKALQMPAAKGVAPTMNQIVTATKALLEGLKK